MPLYLDHEECLVLLQALAAKVDPDAVQWTGPELPTDPTECSRIVWSSITATPIERSLATALAEATNS